MLKFKTRIQLLPLIAVVSLAHHRTHHISQMSANAKPMLLAACPIIECEAVAKCESHANSFVIITKVKQTCKQRTF